MAFGGRTAHEAERQASRLPAFQAADPAHIDLFAAANARLSASRHAGGYLLMRAEQVR